MAQNLKIYLAELLLLSVFLCYRATNTQDGKLKKLPISATTGRSEKWQHNLCEFEVAFQYAQLHGLGVGIAFTKESNIFGIDLDGCRCPATGRLEPWASEIVQYTQWIYWEVSPSGTGIKGIGFGSYQTQFSKIAVGPPIHGRKNQQIEIMTNSRFFALTGQLLDSYERQPMVEFKELEQLYEWLQAKHGGGNARLDSNNEVQVVNEDPRLSDDELLQKASTATNGAKFVAAWNGNWQELNHANCDYSKIDAVLVSMLVFYSSNQEQIERIWLQSPIGQRDKTQSRPDYRKQTIEFALHRQSQRREIERAEHHRLFGSVLDELKQVALKSPKPKAESSTLDSEYVPFPTHLLPSPLVELVVEASQAIGCDASFVALPLLSALASAIGDARMLQAKKDWFVPSILWTGFIGESGTSKSPALRAVMKYPRQRQQQHRQQHEQMRKRYEIEFDAYEAELKRWKSKNLINAGIAKPQPPVEPPFPRTVVNDVTMESLVSILSDNPSGLIAIYDELSGWFGSLNKYRSGADSDGPIWLSIFNAESISVDRKGSGHTYVNSAFVSITGGIQPGLLGDCFTRKHQESGLLARFLMAYPPRILKQWSEDEISDYVDSQMAKLFNYLYELEPFIDETENRRPYLLQFCNEAKAAFEAFYNEHNWEQLSNRGNIAAAYSKQQETPLRLAIIFHCVKQGMGVAQDHYIDLETMQSAIELTSWFKTETRRIYSSLALENRKSNREQLIKWIATKGEVTPRDLQRSSKTKYPNAETAETALNDLVMAGLGCWEEVPTTKSGGRPSRKFRLSD